MLKDLFMRFNLLFHRKTAEADLAEELRAHYDH